MALAAEAAHLRRLCDVQLKPSGGWHCTTLHANNSQPETVLADQSDVASEGPRDQRLKRCPLHPFIEC